jgi:hypothetical protein
MNDDPIDDLGPVDYLVLEFPADKVDFTGEMASALVDLVDSGAIRVLDLLVLHKDEGGLIDAFEIDDLEQLDEIRRFDCEIAEILAADDVTKLAGSMENGSTAIALVWENLWAAPFGSAARRAGGQLVASGRIPIHAIAASIEAELAESAVGDT